MRFVVQRVADQKNRRGLLLDGHGDDRTGRPAILVTAPVPGHGAVIAFVDLVGLGATVADLFGGPRELEFLITTGDGGTIVARWPDGGRWTGTATPDSRFAESPSSLIACA